MKTRHLLIGGLAACAVALATSVSPSARAPRFFSDDPLAREPETQDASGVAEWEIDLSIDLVTNLFGRPGDPTPDVRSKNVNTVDEIPDSNWFTNRIVRRSIGNDELARGPLAGSGPVPGRWSVSSPKLAGFAPGFTMTDAEGTQWFVSFDAAGFPEAATGAIAVANKIFWALGYWQVENYLVSIDPGALTVSETATYTPVSGRKRAMRSSDLDEVFRRAHQGPDGRYRAIASRAVPGRPVGGFRYYGTRPDDPNDVIPHEHRRELRALKVFGAWTNLVDMKAGNTLDSVIEEDGRHVVRHYLQDVGSTFGTGANGPREYDEGWEYLYDRDLVRKRFVRLGFVFEPWQTARYEEHPAIGRFEGDLFEPEGWRPRVPTAALLRARADDNFWAARRVAAFTDEMIRTVVATGSYSDPNAAKLLADILIKRRNKIAAAYLPAVNPLVDFSLSAGGVLAFRNAAVDAAVGVPPAGGYRATWAAFDNVTQQSTPIGPATIASATNITAPGPLPAGNTMVRIEVVAVEPVRSQWTQPVTVYFRRTADGYSLVGLDRLP
jgi:hypothetical protein